MKNRKKNDLILIISLLVAAALILLVYNSIRAEGAVAVVTWDKEVTATYPLDEDRTVLLIPGKEPQEEESIEAARSEAGNNDYNILVIRDGSASVEDASCRDRLCVKQHSAKKTGDAIVCLPNKTIVSVEGAGGASDDEADFISN